MNSVSRRNVIAGTAAAAALVPAAAGAQQAAQTPQPSRAPNTGGTDPGPRDLSRTRQNPDMLNPPSTDHGTLPNLRFSYADAHVRQESGGWTRQVTVREPACAPVPEQSSHGLSLRISISFSTPEEASSSVICRS